jgi:thiamine kinase-like enzyme
VPCNNDLLAANFIDDVERVWLIDYEYSGNNDACFELGNTSTECNFTAEQTQAWTAAYFGTLTAADLARVRLQALCSEYGWSLWGFIQAATSPIDYDFREWGMHRFDKAEATFRGADFERLLAEVATRG